MSGKQRLAVVTSHVIQYQGPLFRLLAAHPDIELKVFFCTDHGLNSDAFDPGFNTKFSWSRPLTDGYEFEVLRNLSPKPNPTHFWAGINPTLWQRLRAGRFDALLVLGWRMAMDWLSVGIAKAQGMALLLRGESNAGSYVPRTPLKHTIRQTVLSAYCRQADALLPIGSRNRSFYRSLGIPDEDLFLTPYAVDNDFFEEHRARLAPQRKALRAALGVHDERPVVLASGKLIPRKAPLDLLEAYAAVHAERRALMVFAGDGPLRGELETRAAQLGVAEDVLVTGFKQQEALTELYTAADLFVFPTRFETWGLVLNEAMLFGLPVICTHEASASEDLVLPGTTGDLYHTGDTEALSQLLRTRLGDPAALRRMGEAGRALITDWSFHKCVDSIAAALEHAAEKRGRSQGAGGTARATAAAEPPSRVGSAGVVE